MNFGTMKGGYSTEYIIYNNERAKQKDANACMHNENHCKAFSAFLPHVFTCRKQKF